ncbi:predicted protein [Mycobacterium tuberculosis T17]|nr:predicted protein [Mycobacterium tuberculosis T17]
MAIGAPHYDTLNRDAVLRHSVKYPHTAEQTPCGSYVRAMKPDLGARSEPASGPDPGGTPLTSARMLVPVAAAGDRAAEANPAATLEAASRTNAQLVALRRVVESPTRDSSIRHSQDR